MAIIVAEQRNGQTEKTSVCTTTVVMFPSIAYQYGSFEPFLLARVVGYLINSLAAKVRFGDDMFRTY